MSAVRKLPERPLNKDLAAAISDLHNCLDAYREKALGDNTVLSGQISQVAEKVITLHEEVSALKGGQATIVAAVEKVVAPFEEVDVAAVAKALKGVDVGAVVRQFSTIDTFFKNTRRLLITAAGIILAAIVGSWANLYFQNEFTHDQIHAVDVGGNARYSAKQGAKDTANTDTQLKTIEQNQK